MPSKKYIYLDEYDSRVALYSDEAFQQGITFDAKVIHHSMPLWFAVCHSYLFLNSTYVNNQNTPKHTF